MSRCLKGLSEPATVVVFRTGVLGTWREKFAGISAFARSVGWRLQSVDARSGRPDVESLINFWHPAGAVVEASGAPDRLRPEDFGSIPVVFMNPGNERSVASAPSVSSDSAAIAKIAASELLGNQPASLVFIEWFQPQRQWSETKKKAMRKIAGMHGLPFLTITPAPGDETNAAIFQKRVAAQLRRMPRPCGILAATDAIGAVALSAVSSLGASIPEDFAVVGVDDDPEVCEGCTPALTSVRPDFFRLGFAAGRLLADEIAHRSSHAKVGQYSRKIIVPPLGIARRASTRALRRFDPKVAGALEFIRLKAREGITPADVAALFGASRRAAELRFKAATGKTIGEEILERRLTAACEYLRDGTATVAAVAGFCGWKSDLAFRKAFKSRFGVPPLAWVKRQTKNAPSSRRAATI